jgi:NADH-quinone oxidoreductase subunit J
MDGISEQMRLLAPLGLGMLAMWLLLPRDGRRAWVLGGMFGVSALLAIQSLFLPPAEDWVFTALFYAFGGGAVLSAGLMVTDRNPVYSALWFAVTTLCVCGLFLINSAPFLAAATVIVYAGAIVVTFVFVIMLAQQAGSATYDRRSYQPIMATVASFLLLGGLLYALQEWSGRGPKGEGETAAVKFLLPPADRTAHALSLDRDNDLGSLRGVGRSLFGDYLYVVELAGTVLLIATIGTIALAPRRSQGTL